MEFPCKKMGNILQMKIQVLIIYACYAYHVDGLDVSNPPCRILPLLLPTTNTSLTNHVIANMTVTSVVNCGTKCFLSPRCISVNYQQLSDNKVTCELSSSDHLQNPLDMVPRPGFSYQGTKNGCSSSPCPVNTTCVPGPTQDTHTCACPSGYTGVDCENDVDECSDGQSPCHVSANCSNTLGSFTCTCKDGFTGDGLTCKDVNECLRPNACHVNATCTNTIGSYNCSCQTLHHGDGHSCLLKGTSCQEIHSRFPHSLDGMFYIVGNHGYPYLAHCDMTSFGGGWTMCYTSSATAPSPITEVTYDPIFPYGTDGYKTDCNNIYFNEVMFVREDAPREKAYFRRQDGASMMISSSLGDRSLAQNGKWDSRAFAPTSFTYQLLVCDTSLYKGFHLSGLYNTCVKLCNQWCGDWTTPFFRSAAFSDTYRYPDFNQKLREGRTQVISVGIRVH